jgi:hypothetical protein
VLSSSVPHQCLHLCLSPRVGFVRENVPLCRGISLSHCSLSVAELTGPGCWLLTRARVKTAKTVQQWTALLAEAAALFNADCLFACERDSHLAWGCTIALHARARPGTVPANVLVLLGGWSDQRASAFVKTKGFASRKSFVSVLELLATCSLHFGVNGWRNDGVIHTISTVSLSVL